MDSNKAFFGCFRNKNLVIQSSSGGAATAIAMLYLKSGGVVFGTKYSEDFKSVEYACIEQEEDLLPIKGTKYVQVSLIMKINGEKVSVFSAVEDKLKQNLKVLFIGTGCVVGALKKFLNNCNVATDNLLTVDLICHGPAVKGVFEQYIDSLQKKYNSKISDFSVRYKKEKWTPIYLRVVFQNGRIFIKPLYHTDFGYAFSFLTNKACYSCRYKGENHPSDITIGDYWGASPELLMKHPYGLSVFIVHNNKGLEIISNLDSVGFEVTCISIDTALNNNRPYFYSRERDNNAIRFEKYFKNKNLHHAVIRTLGFTAYVKAEYLMPILSTILPKRIKKIFRRK